ncbi:MAG: nucleotidyltransferase domain-containing protein [Anaerolineae bacterium]|nr:nucleotidyltransferase domain-containing protein [Gloeobacterales cyanobacterium ES-bin-313]
MSSVQIDLNDPRLQEIVKKHPFSLLFTTLSGAHLYGFPSPDSDYDLRGVHILPLNDIVGLDVGQETVESMGIEDGLEIDLVTHDVYKFFSLLLKKNGYVLEQLYSPLILQTTPEHVELKVIAKQCITRFHSHHYLGFAQTQWKFFEKEQKVKPLLYVFRVLLTGIYLMQTGEIEANLLQLNQVFQLHYLDELIALKLASPEKSQLKSGDLTFFASEYERLCQKLEAAHQKSNLPNQASGKLALNDLLLRIRLGRFHTIAPSG